MDIQDVDRRRSLRYLGYRGQEADGGSGGHGGAVHGGIMGSCHTQASVPGISFVTGEDYRIDGGCFEARSRNLWGI